MKQGVRLAEHKNGVLQVQQIVRRETDQRRERFIKPYDDAGLISAIRAALKGQL
jgi:hypothetical protein